MIVGSAVGWNIFYGDYFASLSVEDCFSRVVGGFTLKEIYAPFRVYLIGWGDFFRNLPIPP